MAYNRAVGVTQKGRERKTLVFFGRDCAHSGPPNRAWDSPSTPQFFRSFKAGWFLPVPTSRQDTFRVPKKFPNSFLPRTLPWTGKTP